MYEKCVQIKSRHEHLNYFTWYTCRGYLNIVVIQMVRFFFFRNQKIHEEKLYERHLNIQRM